MALLESFHQAAAVLKACDSIVITAGAGMGVDSGLPDFRGPEGFWRAYPPMAKLGLRFEQMSTPSWFQKDPAFAWGFFGHRHGLYTSATPHAGYTILKQIAETKPKGYFVFTSNVDGQFEAAGYDREKIVECHGTIRWMQCTRPCTDDLWPVPEGTKFEINEDFRCTSELPVCKNCKGLARPNILMFSDGNWVEHRTCAQESRLDEWLDTLDKGSNLAIVEMGAGLAVPTVRYTGESMARRMSKKGVQATLIRLNPRESQVPQGNISLPVGAKQGIEQIAKILETL